MRVAVIGAGVMGSDHARILAEDLPGAHLQVVCDASGDRARSVADALGASDAATDAMATLVRSDVDAVLIASPDETHAHLSIAAIQAAKPILCEKAARTHVQGMPRGNCGRNQRWPTLGPNGFHASIRPIPCCNESRV